MEELIKYESIQNFEKGDIIRAILLILVDIIILIIFSFHLKCKDKKIGLLKFQLLILCITDIYIRIIFIKNYYEEDSLYKEILFTFFYSFDLYLMIIMIEQSLNYILISNRNKFKEIIYQIFISIIFLIIIFPYEKIFNFSSNIQNIIIIIQNIIISIYIFILYEYIKKKLIELSSILMCEIEVKNSIYLRFLNSPISILIFYIFYFILKTSLIFINDYNDVILVKLFMIVIKESTNYFIYLILNIMITLLNKISIKKIYKNISIKNTNSLDE